MLSSCIMLLMALAGSEPKPEVAELMLVANRYEDIELVAAVTATESNFRTEVVSEAGAIGLMQIMPATAEWLYLFYGELCGLSEAPDLKNPGTNVAFGSCFLQRLHNRYNGDRTRILIHYHSGGGAVKRFNKGKPLGPRTANYVLKVLEYYKQCKDLP